MGVDEETGEVLMAAAPGGEAVLPALFVEIGELESATFALVFGDSGFE